MSNNLEIISCVTDNSVLVQKSHVENFMAKTQLIVNESQEALFFKEGQALDLFLSGRHSLNADNLPIFKKIFGKLFGGKTPFTCDVFFINKVTMLNIPWALPHGCTLEDPQYHLMINLRANGQTTLRVKDSRKFVVKVVGQLPEFTVDDITSSIRNMMRPALASTISNTLINEKVGILEISAHLERLSALIQEKFNQKLDDLGLEVTHLDINAIFAEDGDLDKLKEAKEKRLTMMTDADLEAYKIETLGKAQAASRAAQGYSYQDERRFDVLATAAGNTGSGGSMINTGMGLGMGLGMMGEMSRVTANTMQQAMNPQPTPAGKSCPGCGGAVAPGAKFCPNCGNAMPTEATCPGCGNTVAPGAKFCANCGQSLAPAKKFCPECGNQVEGNAQFCPNCGKKF